MKSVDKRNLNVQWMKTLNGCRNFFSCSLLEFETDEADGFLQHPYSSPAEAGNRLNIKFSLKNGLVVLRTSAASDSF